MLGDHWKRLGFASGDPISAMNKSGGVFNVLCVLYLIQEFSEDAQLLANKAEAFSVLSVGASRLAAEAAQSGRLTAAFNKQREVVGASCVLYVAALRRALVDGSVDAVSAEARTAEGIAKLLEIAPIAVATKA